MAMGFSSGLMDLHMKARGSTIHRMVLAYIEIDLGMNTKDYGGKVNATEKEATPRKKPGELLLACSTHKTRHVSEWSTLLMEIYIRANSAVINGTAKVH